MVTSQLEADQAALPSSLHTATQGSRTEKGGKLHFVLKYPRSLEEYQALSQWSIDTCYIGELVNKKIKETIHRNTEKVCRVMSTIEGVNIYKIICVCLTCQHMLSGTALGLPSNLEYN